MTAGWLRASLLVLFAGCTGDPEAEELFRDEKASLVPGWTMVDVDTSNLWQGSNWIRRQIADVLPLGEKKFAVAWGATDESLFMRTYDVATGFVGSRVTLAGAASTTSSPWARAMSGGPVISSDVFCTGGLKRTSFFAVSQRGTISMLIGVTYCTSFTWVTCLIEDGDRASAAWSGTKGMFVYGRNGSIYGQFFDGSGTALGSEMVLDAPSNATFVTSTDIIWNPVSQRFIVGFMAGVPNDWCLLYNRRFDINGSPDGAASIRGGCDPGTRGHHTSIAIDFDNNPNGRYAWWYEDSSGTGNKAVFIHDQNGAVVAGQELDPNLGYTIPVSARMDGSSPVKNYMALYIPLTGFTLQAHGFSVGSPGWTFMDYMATGVNNTNYVPVALGTLQSETVAIWRQASPANWWLSVSDQ